MNKRNVIRWLCLLVALGCFGYIFYYNYQKNRTDEDFSKLASVADKIDYSADNEAIVTEVKPEGSSSARKLFVLKQYRQIYKKNRNFIGWINIPDTKINYPVMKSQNGNGEYYLNHNFNQEEDRNGTLFMDDACDVIKPSENWLIYGHNMASGNMFGELDNYKSKSFWEKHKTLQFDTIYETGKYAVMFAFQSHVFTEAEVAFKYYQFIEPASEVEFNSGMAEMKASSFYDTGVSAVYGDRLLILSTCDYDEANGRFVVVCVRKDT
ncbi:sortase B [Lachnospiraceae bacterium KH1T2]|nr:sortase B [Lachnospiraceae bacterium KH1T2]